MNMKELSIIIPIYNDYENISKCLSNILKNLLKIDYEIICVDDGSTDSSYQTVMEFANKHKRVRAFSQNHRGLSAARNYGLTKATGEYIYFIDSDDLIVCELIDNALSICKDYSLEVLFFSFENFVSDKNMYEKYQEKLQSVKRQHPYNKNVVTGKELHKTFWKYKEYFPMVWLQFVRRDWLLATGITFKEGLIYEDNLYTFRILLNAQRTMCINDIIYKKQIRQNSITTRSETIESVYSFLFTYIEMINQLKNKNDLFEYIGAEEKIGKFQKSYELMLNDIKSTFIRRYNRLNHSQKNELKTQCNSVENEVIDILIPKVSIIIPMYNSSEFITECIKSVQGLSIKNIEIIVVDDGSTDNSAEIVKSLMKTDRRINYYYQENQGSGPARNFGISKSTGEYIAFLDADDFYYNSNALEDMVNACKKHNTKICGSIRMNYKNGEFEKTDFLSQFHNVDKSGKVISFSDCQFDFFYQSFIFQKDLIVDNKISFPKYRRYQDPPFFLKAMDISGEFAFVPCILYCYRKGHQNNKKNGRFIFDTLSGIRDNLLISENKYEKIFLSNILRIENMYLNNIKLYWSNKIQEILLEINEIYKRKYPENGDMSVISQLTDYIK